MKLKWFISNALILIFCSCSGEKISGELYLGSWEQDGDVHVIVIEKGAKIVNGKESTIYSVTILGETYLYNTEVKKKTTAQLVDGELQLEDGSRIRYSTERRRRFNGKYTSAYILYEENFYVKKGSDE